MHYDPGQTAFPLRDSFFLFCRGIPTPGAIHIHKHIDSVVVFIVEEIGCAVLCSSSLVGCNRKCLVDRVEYGVVFADVRVSSPLYLEFHILKGTPGVNIFI